MTAPSVFGEFAAILLIAGVAGATAGVIVFQLFSRIPGLAVWLAPENRRARILVRRSAQIAFGVLLFAYVAVFSALMILKHQTFHTGYDFSIFDQVVWNSLQGRLLETSITPLSSSWLGTHFAPILLAFVPLYALWNDPQVLLIFQTLALAFTAFPLYWLARKWVGHVLAVTITLVFFLFPALEYVNLSEFHEIALATPLLALAVYFLLEKRWVPFLVSLLLTFLLREEVAFIAIAFGIVVFFYGKPRLGLGLVVLALFWAVALFQFIIPHFSVTQNYIVTGLHYGALGNSPTEIVSSVLSKPDLVLQTILAPAKMEFVFDLLVPLALLPLVGLEITALALPTFGYLLLTGDAQASIYYQYPAPIIPILFLGSVLGLRRVLNWSVSLRLSRWNDQPVKIRRVTVQAALAILLLVASLSTYYLYAPGPLARNFDSSLFTAEPSRDVAVRALMDQIPSDAALLTYGGLTPHLSHRTRVYYYPFVNDFRQAEFLLMDFARCAWCNAAANSMLASGHFETLSDQAGFFLARRRPFEHSLQVQFGDQVSLIGYTIIATDTVRGGQTLSPIFGWRAEQDLSERYVIQIQILDPRGHVWVQNEHASQGGIFPTTFWRRGETIGDPFVLRLPSTMPPDEYSIVVKVYDPAKDRDLVARDPAGQSVDGAYPLTRLHIEKDKSSITATQLREQYLLEQPHFVDMQEIRLLGFKPIPETMTAGQTLPVGLYWRARNKPRGDYSVAVQLRDGMGRVAFEQADRPVAGAYPTTEWAEGEVLLDWHDLALPNSLAPGTYSIQVRLTDSNGALLGEASIAAITVEKP